MSGLRQLTMPSGRDPQDVLDAVQRRGAVIARRRRRVRVAALLAGVSVMVASAAVVAGSLDSPDRVKVVDSPPTTATPLTAAPPPTSTSGPTSTTTTTVAKEKAASTYPGSGYCPEATTVAIEPDVPQPRCVKVTAGQRLVVKNDLTVPATATLGRYSVRIPPGASRSLGPAFGTYLEPGVHRLHASPPGYDGEVWLSG